MRDQMNNVLMSLGIDGTCIHAKSHRHFAFYDIQLSQKSSALSRLEKSAKDIALHLRTKTIPIMKLVPEEGIVRIQAAIKDSEIIYLNNILSKEILPSKMVMPLLLGEDDNGDKLWMDMKDNPHLIIAGSTGSGKSTLLHSIIANALYMHALSFRSIGIFLSDPKRVEFNEYKNGDLYPIIQNISSSYDDVLDNMNHLEEVMNNRYDIMHEENIRSIEEDPRRFTLFLCIIDEFSELIMQERKGGPLRKSVVKLAQKGRAAGIFLIIATQRPSVDVIDGLIKANFPGRIACKTASRKDSEVVLDRPGAETLLGRGDALLQNAKISSTRFQVAYITPQTIIHTFKWLWNKRCSAA